MTKLALIEFAPEVLAQMLKLPAGVVITGVEQPIDRHGALRVRVQGMGWELVDGSFIPTTRPILTTVQEEGEMEARIVAVDWGCPQPDDKAPGGG